MLKRIAVTGPESTGKSALARDLAVCFGAPWVPEYARAYLGKKGPAYTPADLDTIAKGQLGSVEEATVDRPEWLFADTELIVIKIWYEHAFGHCPSWLMEEVDKQQYDLYLLCDVDLPWRPDPLREHPDLRDHFFGLFRQELGSRGFPFVIISGKGKRRLAHAIRAICGKFHVPFPDSCR